MNSSDDKHVVKVYRNEDIRRIVAFIPKGHRHIRIMIETDTERMVFQEATIASLIRAYINVKLHPSRNAIELETVKLEERKPGYASHQLIETGKDESHILEEIPCILNL